MSKNQSEMISTKELFEGHMECLKGASPKDIQKAKELYEYIVNQAAKANYLNEGLDDKIDEGLLTGLLTGTVSSLLGPTVMKAVCKCLGISNGPLFNLLTSSLVCGAVGYELGK